MEREANALVSIVVPVYNAAEHFQECMDNLLGQSYENIEIVLVDDGSTDESPAMCDGFAEADSRVKVFHNENHGVSYTRNFGMDQAKGDYLVFVDSDDILRMDGVKVMLDAIELYEADLVFSGFKRFGLKKQPPRTLGGTFGVSMTRSQQDLAQLYLDTKTNMFGVSIWAKMYRMSVLRDNNVRFDENANYEEDCLFVASLFPHVNTAVAVREVLYYYRQNAESLSKGYRRDSWRQLVNGYRARRDYVQSVMPEDKDISGIGYPFLVAYDLTANKVFASSLTDAEKMAEYQALVDTPELQEVCDSGLSSSVTYKKELIAAVKARDASGVERALKNAAARKKAAKIPGMGKIRKLLKR